MKISTFLKPLSFLPAIAIMYMIFSFSSQPGETSSSLSYSVSRKIVQAVDVVTQSNWEEWQIDEHANQIHGIVRKGAHITEYFLLALAVSFPLYVYGVRGILLMLLAGGICVAYACLDEYHQSMVAARGPSARDVMIDSIGIFAGVILTRLIGWSGRMAITGPAYERRQKKQQRELDEREEMLRRREAALRQEEKRLHSTNASMRRDERRYHDERANDHRYRDDHLNERRYRDEHVDERRYRDEHVDERRYRDERASVQERNHPYRSASSPAQNEERRYRAERADAKQQYHQETVPGDRTIVLGSEHEVDDRTRVYRTPEQQKRMESAYRSQVYERRRVQSQELQDDSTSDQLSDDLPLSGLFGKKKKSTK